DRRLHSPSFLETRGDARYTVPLTTLDGYLGAHPLACIDVLKIDVEGFEPNVLRGAEQTLRAGKVGAILCELNEVWLNRNASSSAELDGQIRSFGYAARHTKAYSFYRNVF